MLCCDLASMMPFRRSAGTALHIVVAATCCLGIWDSLQLARADHYFRKDTDQSIRMAIRMVPDGWPYYMRLAQYERANARELLSTSLKLNPYDAQANIELGLQYEADGDYARAQKQLLQAYNIDHTYLPRWTLANYYFRRGNMPEFWAWARSAAAMPSDDIGGLLELCWRAAPDPAVVTGAILNEKPEFLRQYINYLVAKNEPRAAAEIAPHLIRAGDPQSDLPVLFGVVNRLIQTSEARSADTLWRLLIGNHWVVADSSIPNNDRFARTPLPVGFDWSIPEYTGLHSWPGVSGLETEFAGTEPENCVIAEQYVVLSPGNYQFNYSYRTSEIPKGAGIQWQVLDPGSQLAIAESSDLSSNEMKQSVLSFTVPPGMSLLSLRLTYKRPLGMVRVSGALRMQSVQIQRQ